MKITKEWLAEKEDSENIIEYFLDKNLENIEELEVIDTLIKDNKLRYANWFIPHLLTHREQVQYAVFAATPAVDIFEKYNKKEKAPRKALEAAKNWLENPNEENRNACKVAAEAAVETAAAATGADALIKTINHGIKLLKQQKNEE